MTDNTDTTAPDAGARTTRRTFLTRAAVTGAAVTVPAVAMAARPEPDLAEMDGMAAFNIDGRRLLVDTNRTPKPGDEVVAFMPAKQYEAPKMAVYRADTWGEMPSGMGPWGDRTAFRDVTPPGSPYRHASPGIAIGVVVNTA